MFTIMGTQSIAMRIVPHFVNPLFVSFFSERLIFLNLNNLSDNGIMHIVIISMKVTARNSVLALSEKLPGSNAPLSYNTIIISDINTLPNISAVNMYFVCFIVYTL